MRIKKNLLVLFGGMSNEHEVSHMSVKNVIRNINRELYNLHIVGITKMGRWIYVRDIEEIENKSWIYADRNAYIIPDREKHALVIIEDDTEREVAQISIDVCFPVLHGKMGEDGAIQGLLELAGIPYVGCGILSSAICLDKIVTKSMVKELDIRQADYIRIDTKKAIQISEVDKEIQEKLGYPVYVKPSDSGSSVGVTKVNSKEDIAMAIEEAGKHSNIILIEETIVGREIECAIIGDKISRPLALGEVVAGDEFYSYDAKYNNDESKTIVNPELPFGIAEKIFDAAVRIYDRLGCFSLARVDFFVEKDTNDIVFNEINTMPGFTNISMYPMLAQHSGMSSRELIEALLQTAFRR